MGSAVVGSGGVAPNPAPFEGEGGEAAIGLFLIKPRPGGQYRNRHRHRRPIRHFAAHHRNNYDQEGPLGDVHLRDIHPTFLDHWCADAAEAACLAAGSGGLPLGQDRFSTRPESPGGCS
jgi:hypothetical protein